MTASYATGLEHLIVASPAISIVLVSVWLLRPTIDHVVRRVLDFVGQVVSHVFARWMESWKMHDFRAMPPAARRDWVRLVEAERGRSDPPDDEV